MKTLHLRLNAVALTVWVACFWVLERTGNWLPFAFAGGALGVAVVSSGAVPRALLRLQPGALLAGTLAGVAMVLATHLGYRLVASIWPSVVPATGELMSLLNVVGYPAWARTSLITTIAGSEELIFRGLLPVGSNAGGLALPRERLLVIAALSLCYALATAPLGSALLVGCALVCGLIWAALRVATGSLLAPLLAHVLWDLGVLLLWPLPTFR